MVCKQVTPANTQRLIYEIWSKGVKGQLPTATNQLTSFIFIQLQNNFRLILIDSYGQQKPLVL